SLRNPPDAGWVPKTPPTLLLSRHAQRRVRRIGRVGRRLHSRNQEPAEHARVEPSTPRRGLSGAAVPARAPRLRPRPAPPERVQPAGRDLQRFLALRPSE